MAKRKAYKVLDSTTGTTVWRDCETHEIIPDFTSVDVECCLAVAAMKCLRKRDYSLFYDNGVTPGSSTNTCGLRPNFVSFSWAFTVLGWETGLGTVGAGEPLGPFTGCTPQLQGWVAFGDNNTPYENTDYNFQSIGAPTWRSWKVEGCDPDAKYGRFTIEREDGCVFTIYPLGYSEQYTDIERLDFYSCKTNAPETRFFQWVEVEGEKVREEIPCPSDIACYRSCDYKFDPVILEGAESDCATQEFRACDANNNGAEIIIFRTDCPDGSQTTVAHLLSDYLAADSPEIDEYDLSEADLVNCTTGEPFVFPEVPCEQTYEECKDPCSTVATYIFGRPPTQGWAWPDLGIEATDLNDFEAQLTSQGYTVDTWGEKHFVCPVPAGSPTVDGDPVELLVEPNPNPNFVPKDQCASHVSWSDCMKEWFLSKMENLFPSRVECEDESGAGGSSTTYEIGAEAPTEQSFGIGDVIGDGSGGIKFDTNSGGNPAYSAGLQAAHNAIISCIQGGGVANTVITDQDGNTSELDLDVIGGSTDPSNSGNQLSYGGTVIDGDPGGGKVRKMVVTCSNASSTETKWSWLVTICGFDKLLEASSLDFREVCLLIDGEAVPGYAQFSKVTGGDTGVTKRADTGEVGGFALHEDPCACCKACEDGEETVRGCTQFNGFDYLAQDDLSPGETISYDVNGTVAVLDYLSTSDGINKSTWYTPLMNVVNATNFSMSLVSDASVTSSDRPWWQIDYNGPGNETLVIDYGTGVLTFTAGPDGTLTTSADFAPLPEDGSYPFRPCE